MVVCLLSVGWGSVRWTGAPGGDLIASWNTRKEMEESEKAMGALIYDSSSYIFYLFRKLKR